MRTSDLVDAICERAAVDMAFRSQLENAMASQSNHGFQMLMGLLLKDLSVPAIDQRIVDRVIKWFLESE